MPIPQKDETVRAIKRFVSLTATALLVACAGAPLTSERGRVVDVSTTPPAGVSDVQLLFLFRGTESAFPESVDMCDGAATAVSGKDGFFDWPSRPGRETHVIAYKSGYVLPTVRDDRRRHQVYLTKSLAHNAVMNNFSNLASACSCRNIGADSQPIANFLAPVLQDARSQAEGGGDEGVVKRIEQRIRLYDTKSN